MQRSTRGTLGGMSHDLPVTPRTKLRRRPQRGHHDFDTIAAILDAAPMVHVATAIDGRPFCTPTLGWRIDDRVFFHGAPAGRMSKALADGAEACLVASILDGLVLARSAFHHSVCYRSVVVFGVARVETGEAKRAALEAMIEGLYPGRSATIRGPSEKELAATAVLSLPIEEASAKVRTGGPVDDAADAEIACWAGVVPVRLATGRPEPDGLPAPEPPYLARPGRLLA